MTKAADHAFPFIDSSSPDLRPGLTKREYFAAMAMQGLLPQVGMNSQFQDAYDIAVWSAQAADALIAELAKAEPEAVIGGEA